MQPVLLTVEEERAIATLKRLAKRWPKTLWLYSGSGVLIVMRCGPDGKHAMLPGIVFPECLGAPHNDQVVGEADADSEEEVPW